MIHTKRSNMIQGTLAKWSLGPCPGARPRDMAVSRCLGFHPSGRPHAGNVLRVVGHLETTWLMSHVAIFKAAAYTIVVVIRFTVAIHEPAGGQQRLVMLDS